MSITYSLENQVPYSESTLRKAIDYILPEYKSACLEIGIPKMLRFVAEYHFVHEHVRLSISRTMKEQMNYNMALFVCRCASIDLEKFGQFQYDESATLNFITDTEGNPL